MHRSWPIYSCCDTCHFEQDRVGIMIDDSGHPVLGAFTFPTWPSALITTSRFVLAVCSPGMHAYDLRTSEPVQTVPFADSEPSSAADQYLSAVRDQTGSQILVHSSHKVRKTCIAQIYSSLSSVTSRRRHAILAWSYQIRNAVSLLLA